MVFRMMFKYPILVCIHTLNETNKKITSFPTVLNALRGGGKKSYSSFSPKHFFKQPHEMEGDDKRVDPYFLDLVENFYKGETFRWSDPEDSRSLTSQCPH